MAEKRSGKASTATRLELAAFVAALFGAWLAMFVEGTGTIDREIMGALYVGHSPTLAQAARLLTFFGSVYFVMPLVGLVAVVLAWRGRSRTALVLFVGNAMGRVLVDLQKYELNRLRPDLNPHLVTVHNLSFPSGHSASAVVAYVALALLLVPAGRKRELCVAAALLLSMLIGVTRVMLGVHWPSDVVAGWSFGLLWVLVMLWIAKRAEPGMRANGRAQ